MNCKSRGLFFYGPLSCHRTVYEKDIACLSCEEFPFELEQCMEQLDTDTAFQRACAQGTRWFMDDLKAGRKVVVGH